MRLRRKSKIFLALSVFFIFSPILTSAETDTDNDGLSDAKENLYYTDPEDQDTDNDGFLDGEEVKNGYSPHKKDAQMHEHDYDNDGLNDWVERWFNSDIGKVDTDDDGYNDFDEVMAGYSPTIKSKNDNGGEFERKILIDKTNQQLYPVVGGIKIKKYPVSTGLPTMPTPSGDFKIQRKVETKPYVGPGYYYPNVHWNIQFKPLYYIHGTYWHNDFGIRPKSHGCVNMRTKDAKELYKYFDTGSNIEIIGEASWN